MSEATDKNISIDPNPGGTLEASQVLGRHTAIEELWRVLGVQSVALLAPRRMGKTSILTRMAAEPPEGTLVVKRNLEGLESAAEFVQILFEDVEELLGRWRCRATRAQSFIDKLAVDSRYIKMELQGPSWKRLLERLFDDLQEHVTKQDKQLVFMWDEVTLFLGDLVRRERANEAMVLLDALRSARQRCARVRMVLTGSIGFEEVLRSLRREHAYANRPINDVSKYTLPLLDAPGSMELIQALLPDSNKGSAAELARTVHKRCEGHPFLIQLVVERLVRRPSPAPTDVDEALSLLLEPPGDPFDLLHYLERIDQHYDGPRAQLARELLDALAVAPEGLQRGALVAKLAHGEREVVLTTLRQLEDDFYLRRESGKLRFMLDFVRRFWAEERGL